MVTVNKLVIKFQAQIVLKSVSCSLPSGRITIFIGKSGAGKTTLLKSLVGLVPIAQGSISNGKEITALSPKQRSEEIGYVFQDFNLFPHLSVLRNCMDPLLVHGMPYGQAEQRAREVLQQLEMQNFIDKYPSELSGGQQQRIAIARALCLRPRILVLDEPTASLDPANSANIALLLQELARRSIAVCIASHDMIFVKQLLDRVYILDNGIIVEAYDERIDKVIPTGSALFGFLKNE